MYYDRWDTVEELRYAKLPVLSAGGNILRCIRDIPPENIDVFTQEELQEFVPYHKEYFDITPKKVLISFNIDADILAMMRATGKGYQTRMNKCLREAVLSGRF